MSNKANEEIFEQILEKVWKKLKTQTLRWRKLNADLRLEDLKYERKIHNYFGNYWNNIFSDFYILNSKNTKRTDC